MTYLDQYQSDTISGDPSPNSAVDSMKASLGWLLTAFTREIPSVAHAMAVSADGLALAVSDGLPTDRADQLAAVTCGLASLTDGAARCLSAAPVSHTVVEMRGGVLLVMAIDDRAHLIVLVNAGADLGQVGYETAMLARRVGAALSPQARPS
jgi:predicted regulator of Ras-like GTPase activity (Roadblock/LC7/MglB family)